MSKIGLDETPELTGFLKRLKSPYTSQKLCADPDKTYEWAELRTSLLAQEIMMNIKFEAPLLNFVKNIISRIYGALPTKSLEKDFIFYIEQVGEDEEQGNIYDHYPLAQSPAFYKNPEAANKSTILLFNFLYWSLYKSSYNLNTAAIPAWNHNITMCPLTILNGHYILSFIQDKMQDIQGMIRGDRGELESSIKSDKVGISAIKSYKLDRKLKQFPDYKIKPWSHPGNAKCLTPYWGKWGENIRDLKAQNDPHASLLCGLSGSTNFMYFSYLLSHAYESTKTPARDYENLIMLAIVLLVGDGGHNVREVLYGICSTTVILYTILQEMTMELQDFFENRAYLDENVRLIQQLSYIPASFGPILDALWAKIDLHLFRAGLKCKSKPFRGYSAVFEMFKIFLQSMVNCEESIISLYNFTRDINIVGVTANDLNKHNPNILKNPRKNYIKYKNSLLYFFFGVDTSPPYDLFTAKAPTILNDNIQVFFALENNRYLQNNWRGAANEKIEQIIKKYPDGEDVLSDIDNTLNRKLANCNSRELQGKIPFAFPGRY